MKHCIAAHTRSPVGMLNRSRSVPVLWYATAIAQFESSIQKGHRFLQFNLLGILGPNPDTSPKQIQATPNRSGGGKGWGIYQLTNPAPSINDLWNWQQNVLDAIKLMKEKRSAVPGRIRTQYGNSAKAAIAALCNASITLDGVTFKCGTAHIPIDILAIEGYNGFGPGLAIKYSRTTHRWIPNPPADGYVREVLNAFRHPR